MDKEQEQQSEQFIQRLMDDEALRAEFQRDPHQTAKAAGLELGDDDVKALQSVDWSDEEMVARVSKSVRRGCAIDPTSDVNLKENIVPIPWV
jgi:hypothetical protein